MKQNTERKLKNEIRMVDMKEIKCFCLFVRQLDDRKRHWSFDCRIGFKIQYDTNKMFFLFVCSTVGRSKKTLVI